MLKELKKRCGGAVGGKLYFRLFYTPWKGNISVEADLDDDAVTQTLKGFM
jgi:hypothetical protein